ncbi:MAG: tetratricopeptide repeat protein, partial [Acidobacteriota bacterium]
AAVDAASKIPAKRLRGDLDNIVLKALHKVPEKRYRSVAHLVDDIQRHLDRRPVSARAPSFAYRAGRWIVRHKTAVAAASVVLVLTALYGVQLSVERTRAERSAARAQQTVVALERLFGDFDPFAARGGQVTVRELLDRASANVDRDLAQQPEVQVGLRILLGNLYHKLGAHGPAATLAHEALGQGESLFGPDHPAVGRAATTAANALSGQGRFNDARPLLERAVRILEAHPEARLDDLTEALGRLSRVAWVSRDYPQALELSGRAVALQESAAGPEAPSLAALLSDRADVFLAMDQPREALPLLRRAVSMWCRADGDNGARCGRGYFQLARATVKSGEPEEALPLFQEALDGTASVLGRRHPAIGDILVELGVALSDLGRDEESLDRLREGFVLHRDLDGRGFPGTLRSAGRFGRQLLKMGRYAEARTLYAESLLILEKAVGEGSPHLFSTLFNLGTAAAGCGDLESGLAHHRRGLRLLEQSEAADPSHLRQSREAIADLLARDDSPANEC